MTNCFGLMTIFPCNLFNYLYNEITRNGVVFILLFLFLAMKINNCSNLVSSANRQNKVRLAFIKIQDMYQI